MYHGPVPIIQAGWRDNCQWFSTWQHTKRWTVCVLIMKKTLVTAFHLRNKVDKRSMKVVWNKTELENTTHLKYLGFTLDMSLSYKQHIQNTKMKVATRNNLLTKQGSSKWGSNPSTIQTTALALSYSTAEYAAPVWARSSLAKSLDPELN